MIFTINSFDAVMSDGFSRLTFHMVMTGDVHSHVLVMVNFWTHLWSADLMFVLLR